MPRKAPSDVKEHRITFGNSERGFIEKVATAYQTDKYLENIPNILLGAGVVLAGGGLALGGYTAWVWLTGDKFIDKLKNVTLDGLDNVFGGGLEAIAGYDPIEHIRDRQELRREFNKVTADIDQYCSTGSKNYDEGKCEVAYHRREELIAKREQMQNRHDEERKAAKDNDLSVKDPLFAFKWYGRVLGLDD